MILLYLVIASSNPIDLVRKDISTIEPSQRKYYRYLELTNVENKLDAYLIISGHLQHLSTAADINRPKLIGPLIRIDLRHYNFDPKLWDELAYDDPYYHEVKTVKQQPYYDQYGRAVYPEPKEVVQHLFDVADIANDLQSQAPILKATYFFNQTAIEQDRRVGYYRWLGIKDLASFERLIGFDRKLHDDFTVELRAAQAKSGVTLDARAYARRATLGGAYWSSYDFKVALKDNNPLRIAGREIEKRADAMETFGHLPNGFWATGLFNGKGEAQATAPDFIASDGRSSSNDRRIHANMSCIRCHVEGGLRPITDWHRKVLSPPFEGKSNDPLLRQQYGRKLEPFMKRDRELYTEKLKEATGLDPETYAKKYGEFWELTENFVVDLDRAALETGYTSQRIKEAIEASIKGGYGDPVLSMLIREEPIPIPARQWFEVYPILMRWLCKE